MKKLENVKGDCIKHKLLDYLREMGATQLKYCHIDTKPFSFDDYFVTLDINDLHALAIYAQQVLGDNWITFQVFDDTVYADGGVNVIKCDVVNDFLEMSESTNVTQKSVLKARTDSFRIHDIDCNQWYDKKMGLPYSYHLQMVADVATHYIKLLPTMLRNEALKVAYFHDAIEDARLTYNDVVKYIGKFGAENVVLLTTDVRGKTRNDRAGDWYYKGIKGSLVACFVKLCDRIANIEHGIHHDSPMVKKYFNEMDNFLSKLDHKDLQPLTQHLINLKNVYGK